jgi:hypothetical protein
LSWCHVCICLKILYVAFEIASDLVKDVREHSFDVTKLGRGVCREAMIVAEVMPNGLAIL